MKIKLLLEPLLHSRLLPLTFHKRITLVCSAELPVVFLWWRTALKPQWESWARRTQWAWIHRKNRLWARTTVGAWWMVLVKSKGVNSFYLRRSQKESMQEEGPGDGLTGKFYPPLVSLLSAPSLFRKLDEGEGSRKKQYEKSELQNCTKESENGLVCLCKECLPNIDLIERNTFSFWYWQEKLTIAVKVQIKQIKPICWLKDAPAFQYWKNKIFTFLNICLPSWI